MQYEDLLMEADLEGLTVKDKPLLSADGRIYGKNIAIRKGLTNAERCCTLAEELGHYHTTYGDITKCSTDSERKQEFKARIWGYDKLIGLRGIVSCHTAGCRNMTEMADHLNISEPFLSEALTYYKQKYGVHAVLDNYVIYFEPTLVVFKVI